MYVVNGNWQRIAISCCMVAGLLTAEARKCLGADTTTGPAVRRQNAFFGIHFDLHPGEGDTILGRDATPANIAAFLERVKPDFVQYDCKGHPGYTGYPTKVGWASPGIVKDALKLWREETARRRIGLYIHYIGVWDTVALKHHPEWARVDENGNRDPNSTSVFGDYVNALMIPQLKEVTSEYQLDGVWVDGDCWAARLDYGTTAAMAWKDATGTETLPRKPGDANWQAWKQFHRAAYEKYLVHWVDALHEFNPNLELCSNWSYTPHMPLPIKARVNFLSGDFSAKESVDRARFEARYLASTGMPWDLMAWGFNGYDRGNAPHQIKSAEQLRQEAAVVMGLGGGMQVYFQPTRGGYITRAVAETAGQVADFCRQRQAVSHKSKTVPQVALLLSTKSYLERMENVYTPGGQYNALEGALHVLLESGYSVDLMAEHQLEPVMEKYPVIAIAQAPSLDKAFREKLISYVTNGGKLILLDRESCAGFKKLLGVEFAGDPVQADGYIGDLATVAPAPGLWQKVVLKGARPLALRTFANGETTSVETADRAYGYLESEREIAATIVDKGRGQVVGVYGPLSDAFFQTHHPALRKCVRVWMEQIFPQPEARLFDAPYVDMSLRVLPDGRRAIHLANLAGAQRTERFAALDAVPPMGPVHLKWNFPGKPKRFSVEPEGRVEASFNGEHDGVSTYDLVVSEVPIHGTVIAEF